MLPFVCYSQTGENMDNRLFFGKEHAEKELRKTLSDSTLHNVINNKYILIKDKADAIKIAETMLFPIYSEENIIFQRPYEIHYIDNYWIIEGTLPEGYRGGTFLIILDSRNSTVLRISHGR